MPRVSTEHVNHPRPHVEHTNRAEALRDLSESRRDAPSDATLQPQERHQLAKSTRGHARTVQRADIAVTQGTSLARERVESSPKGSVECGSIGHRRVPL